MLITIISQFYKDDNFNTHSSTPLEKESYHLRSLHPNSYKSKHLLSSQDKKNPKTTTPLAFSSSVQQTDTKGYYGRSVLSIKIFNYINKIIM